MKLRKSKLVQTVTIPNIVYKNEQLSILQNKAIESTNLLNIDAINGKFVTQYLRDLYGYFRVFI